jgi:hypothetical protein
LITALEKLALLSGGTREVYSWHHDSIAKRVERLQTEGADPEAIRRYHRSLRPMRMGLLGLSAVAILLMLSLAMTEGEAAKNPAEETAPVTVQEEAAETDVSDRSDSSDPSDRPLPREGGPTP